MHYICQIGDALGALKVKILTPIPKGMSKNIFSEFVPSAELDSLAATLGDEKSRNGWNIRIIISDWQRIGQGHAILLEPDGRMVASPVWEEPECILPFGNLAEEDPLTLWERYPFKINHLNKYFENSLIVV